MSDVTSKLALSLPNTDIKSNQFKFICSNISHNIGSSNQSMSMANKAGNSTNNDPKKVG